MLLLCCAEPLSAPVEWLERPLTTARQLNGRSQEERCWRTASGDMVLSRFPARKPVFHNKTKMVVQRRR